MVSFLSLSELTQREISSLCLLLERKTGLCFVPVKDTQKRTIALESTHPPESWMYGALCAMEKNRQISSVSKGFNPLTGRWTGKVDDKNVLIHGIGADLLGRPPVQTVRTTRPVLFAPSPCVKKTYG